VKHEHSQTEMFSGTGGTGVKDMPSEHSKLMPNKCTECHYYRGKAEVDNTPLEKGGHTFLLDKNVCSQCHHNPEKMASDWMVKLEPLAKELEGLLEKYPNKTSKVYINAKRNYAMAIADDGMGTHGIHNPKYAEALLKNGISALTSEAAWK